MAMVCCNGCGSTVSAEIFMAMIMAICGLNFRLDKIVVSSAKRLCVCEYHHRR